MTSVAYAHHTWQEIKRDTLIKRAHETLRKTHLRGRRYICYSLTIDAYCMHIEGVARGEFEHNPALYDACVRAMNIARNVLPSEQYAALDSFVSDYRLLESELERE